MSLEKLSVKIPQEEECTLKEFLTHCTEDRMCYATAAERMLQAFGEPEVVDTSKDPRLSRIHENKRIHRYAPFKEFYGMEEVVENIVGFFRAAAQGLEERKQILYLLGPVGGGKSSLAEALKRLIQQVPIYVVEYECEKEGVCVWRRSPVFEHPLSVFALIPDAVRLDVQRQVSEAYGIPLRYFTDIYSHASPWLVKRFHEWVRSQEESEPDISKFFERIRVKKIFPSENFQIGVCKTEPGDENNQDISTLVGKTALKELRKFDQDDPDAYRFSGALCRANQGIMEFVEMFKAPIQMLHPLLTATQEGNYKGTEGLGNIPFTGVILAHSNESEWESFKRDNNNEAFLDRVCLVRVPYTLSVTNEMEIYKKLIRGTSLKDAPCVPDVYKILAKFVMATRVAEPAVSVIDSKLRVYDGETLKDIDPKAKSLSEYQKEAGPGEGMGGFSTRWAFKMLSKTFNYDETEVAANPIHMFYLIDGWIEQEYGAPGDDYKDGGDALADYLLFLKKKYAETLGKEIRSAYLESYAEYGQNVFDRYVVWADHWIQDKDFSDPETHELMDKQVLNEELSSIEKPAGIVNPKDFRQEVVNFVLRARANNGGENPDWRSYTKLAEVIEKTMFSQMDDLLPVLSFGAKRSSEDDRKHKDYVDRMVDKGYTPKQVQLLTEWYMRWEKSQK